MRRKITTIFLILLLSISSLLYIRNRNSLKLYWFIPDGVRAEPYLFDVFGWAEEGKLPNIKKLMDSGSYGYSYPNFPSHTPTNFAALLTGSYPEVNGVNDGPMHTLGKPLNSVAISGFKSGAKKVDPIWKTLENSGYKVSLISVPGSTPPDIENGIVVKGRWGGWGADFPALNFESKNNFEQKAKLGRSTRFFYFGPELTRYIDGKSATGWNNPPKSSTKPYEIEMNAYGATVYGYVHDDKVALSLDKNDIFADLKSGEWSDWKNIKLTWEVGENKKNIDTHLKIAVVKVDGGFFRVRIYYDALNDELTFPTVVASKLQALIGPMVDYPDNFPAQLINYPEDKKIFLDEAKMSFDWHTKVINAILKIGKPNIVIHDIYTPNQMLTSKWWMGSVDPSSSSYKRTPNDEREILWNEVKGMYLELDRMVGEIIKNSDKNTYIVFSSDHGNIPLNTNVNLNNFFASKGWLKFKVNPTTKEPEIDWKNTKVIYLKMAHIYINPNGLAGDYKRSTGVEYENLRNNVVESLKNLKDSNGQKVVVDIVKWEDAKKFMNMDPDRVGDLVVANSPGYGWNEELTKDLKVFSKPSVTGYKQAIMSKEVSGMWTPFLISGPKVKKGNFIGSEPFSLIDQYPTIMKALGLEAPDFVQGRPLDIFNK